MRIVEEAVSEGALMRDERTILLVHDVDMFHEQDSAFLTRGGTVLTASNGDEALRIAKQVRPDVMVVDLMMPGLDGDAVCRFVKNDPDLFQTAVVMLVGVDDPHAWGRAVRAGADDVLAKPLSRVSLNKTVQRFTRGQVPTGQPRIPVDSTVQLKVGRDTVDARISNLSRGGIFLETDCELDRNIEIGLDFVLPESKVHFTPTAYVAWKKLDAALDHTQGLGLRFVDISSQWVRNLEDYVYDHALEPHAVTAGVS
jgi:CheY-like chemotaxis protein/Tfp pilus assembly protein PilZ